jgi:hypothetical protein
MVLHCLRGWLERCAQYATDSKASLSPCHSVLHAVPFGPLHGVHTMPRLPKLSDIGHLVATLQANPFGTLALCLLVCLFILAGLVGGIVWHR